MNGIITSREELLLAKIAGEDVDISTMTPPVAINKREKLLLDIADRLADFSTTENSETSTGLYELNGEIGVNGDGKQTFTLIGVTAEELYTAAASGQRQSGYSRGICRRSRCGNCHRP